MLGNRLLVIFFITFLQNPCWGSSIFPGAYWTDNNGVPIQAHGGGFLVQNDSFFWFGEDKTENSHNFRHVNVYQSNDLVTWVFLGHALSATEETAPGSEIGPDAVVERPKVIYNKKTAQYVMWFHLDSSNYGLAKLGVATSSTPQGPYEYVGSISPFGDDSRDMTVWVDEDDTNKTAYLVYATRVNLDTSIARLTPDYLNVEERLVKLVDIHREAYAVFKHNDLYYIVMSRATGWDANANEYMVSESMSGPWSEGRPIAPTSSNTFESQANYVIPLANGKFLYCGDRWNRYALSDSRYMWLPIELGPGNNISISWKDQWWVDTRTGNTGDSASNTYEATSSEATIIGDAEVVPCTGCSNGDSVGYIGLEGRLRFDGLEANVTSTYSVLVAYANGDSAPRHLSVDVNGFFYTNLTFPTTESGQATKQLVFQVEFNGGNQNSLEFYNDFAFGPDIDLIKVQCYYNTC